MQSQRNSSTLKAVFIGNKQRGADGVYRNLPGQQRASRSLDGLVEVLIELEFTGLHNITVRDLTRPEVAPWVVQVTGICRGDQGAATAAVGTEDIVGRCFCQAGTTLSTDKQRCSTCESGLVKDLVGDNECSSCAGLIRCVQHRER